jgi:TetR/AcrR family transcriptional repressor of lmrAB and yxaGH operons
MSVMPRDTRQRMVKTAAKLLQRQGYHGTGLNQILADSGAPKGSMYFHFPGGKEELAAEAIRSSGHDVDAALADHHAGTAAESLDGYLADVALLLRATDYRDGCPIATVALEVGPAVAGIADACHEAFATMRERVAAWLRQDGIDAATAEDHAFLVYAALEGALVFAKAQHSTEPIDRLRALLPVMLPPARPRSRRRSSPQASGTDSQ